MATVTLTAVVLSEVRRLLSSLEPGERKRVAYELYIDARAEDAIADATAKELERADWWANYQALEPERAQARTKACELRELADEHDRFFKKTPIEAVRENAVELRRQAEALDPTPNPNSTRTRETLCMWWFAEADSSGGRCISTSYCAIVNPSTKLVQEIFRLAETEGLDSDRAVALLTARQLVFRHLTDELEREVQRTHDQPEGEVWARALAMFETHRDY